MRRRIAGPRGDVGRDADQAQRIGALGIGELVREVLEVGALGADHVHVQPVACQVGAHAALRAARHDGLRHGGHLPVVVAAGLEQRDHEFAGGARTAQHDGDVAGVGFAQRAAAVGDDLRVGKVFCERLQGGGGYRLLQRFGLLLCGDDWRWGRAGGKNCRHRQQGDAAPRRPLGEEFQHERQWSRLHARLPTPYRIKA